MPSGDDVLSLKVVGVLMEKRRERRSLYISFLYKVNYSLAARLFHIFTLKAIFSPTGICAIAFATDLTTVECLGWPPITSPLERLLTCGKLTIESWAKTQGM